MSRARQLPLGFDCAPLNGLIDGRPWEREQLVHEITMILRGTRRVTGLEQEREADHDLAGFDGSGHVINPGHAAGCPVGADPTVPG